MDRNFHQQKLAQQHQRELSRELATRSLLKEAGSNSSALKRRVRIVWGVVPVAVTIAVLILLNFLR